MVSCEIGTALASSEATVLLGSVVLVSPPPLVSVADSEAELEWDIVHVFPWSL